MIFHCPVFWRSCEHHKIQYYSILKETGFCFVQFLDPPSSPVGGGSAPGAGLPTAPQQQKKTMSADVSQSKRVNRSVSRVFDFVNLSWTCWIIVFVEVAQFPSVRAPSPQVFPTGTKRRYVPCLGAFCADNQMGLYFCCGQHCCVWRLDRRSTVPAIWWSSSWESEARTRCDWHLVHSFIQTSAYGAAVNSYT